MAVPFSDASYILLLIEQFLIAVKLYLRGNYAVARQIFVFLLIAVIGETCRTLQSYKFRQILVDAICYLSQTLLVIIPGCMNTAKVTSSIVVQIVMELLF